MIGNIISQINQLWKKGFFHLAVSNYSVQLIVFSSHLLIAKIMSPEDVGFIKVIETMISIAVVLGAGGATFAILKLIPENKDELIRNFLLKSALKSTLLFSIGTTILFVLLTYLGILNDEKKYNSLFYLYSLVILPSVLLQMLIRYYQSIDNFKRISVFIFYIKLASAVIILGITYFFFIRGYIISTIITSAVSILLLLFDLRKEFKTSSKEEFTALKKQFNSLSNTAFTSQIVDQAKLHAPFLIAYILVKDKVEFGHYAFALLLVQGMNVLVSSVQQFLIPKMSETSRNLDVFFEKYALLEKKFNWISVGLFVLAQIFIPVFVYIFYGDKYDEAIMLLRIMLLGWLIQGFSSLKGIIFLSLGKMRYVLYSSSAILILSSPVMYFLTLKYGGMGAAWSYVAQNVVSLGCLIFFEKMLVKKFRNN
ncbi:lipopolysaccharide biosynthesis protein [Moheibacter sediminis]|uniref:Membrane protein involved in the export of O-antigen and teichoic acid n=1 Tax=Moheibacter sediminis TaxID=1434700 RepID=A0A1W1YB48_9FLAO|nr:oligosaccharide flippase family protein [Moheibacter sediminis]SMC33344.1 Membrane protein involved in the export of O-antigen and teichoic acid [Moheibacter sediminis]